MKWARIKVPKRQPPPPDDEIVSYHDYPNAESLEKDFNINGWKTGKGESHVWAKYKLKKSMNAKQRRTYEIFCGGFLLFYDDVIRNKAVDHKIYFEWEPTKADEKSSLTIYLSPAPGRPIKKNSIERLAQASASDAGRGAGSEDSLERSASSASGVTDDFDDIDPPAPPPPPPPPRDEL